MIAIATKDWYWLRETHWLMPSQVHEELHETISCYLKTWWDLSWYVLNWTTLANRRPAISQTLIKDEDIPTTLPILNNSLYCVRYLTGAWTTAFTIDNPEIVPVNAWNTGIYYNQLVGATWQQTLVPANNYCTWFVIAVPTTDDTQSQKFRFQFIQPQSITTNQTTARNITLSSISFGDWSSSVPEYCFIAKIVYRVSTVSTWYIDQITKITGIQSNSLSITWWFLTQITTSWKLLAWWWTASNPLTTINLDWFIDYNDLTTQTTPISITANTPAQITCDWLWPYTLATYKPNWITDLYNTTTQAFNFSELAIWDEVMIRVDILVITTNSNIATNIYLTLDIWWTPFNIDFWTFFFKNSWTHQVVWDSQFYLWSAWVLVNPSKMYFKADDGCNIKVNWFYISTKRRYI